MRGRLEIAGPLTTSPRALKREPWHRQSHSLSVGFSVSLTAVFVKKNPEQLVVLGAAVLGLAAYPPLRPDWMLK